MHNRSKDELQAGWKTLSQILDYLTNILPARAFLHSTELLANLISKHIGPEYAHLTKVRFERLDKNTVCVLDVDRASEPAFVDGAKGKEFYVRVGNTTRALDVEETVKYKEMNWV